MYKLAIIVGLMANAGAIIPNLSTSYLETNMRKFEITLTTRDNKRLTDQISASSKFDAEKVMKDRYPGCTIWTTKEIK